MPKSFSVKCTRCQRLADFLKGVRKEYPEYHGRPVEAFGCEDPKLLIVGLAPGMHGANATGRPFTGDYAGILLYETMHEFGFSNQSESTHRGDGLELIDCRITNAVKCLPPQNKPTTDEVNTCNEFLRQELDALSPGAVILTLGGIAHKAVLKALGLKASAFPFKHAASYPLDGEHTLLSSYHCSRYNTQTRRLTADMFKDVFSRAKQLIAT